MNNMFPSSTSFSSSQSSIGPSTGTSGGTSGLMRYGSAPGSFLTNAVDSVLAASEQSNQLGPSRFFPSSSSAASDHQSTVMPNLNDNVSRISNSREDQFGKAAAANTTIGLQRSYGFPSAGGGGGSSSSSSLVRHSSSPAGFLNHLAAAAGDKGFSMTSGMGSYNSKGIADHSGRGGLSRLNSQLSFAQKEVLSRISEENENADEQQRFTSSSTDHNRQRKSKYSYGGSRTAGFGIGSSWDDHANSGMLSVAQPSNKRSLDTMEPQFQFGISQAIEMEASMENYLHHNIPQDSVPCKIRAKRGCATHPRSIAERERRTRISGKLKKLQDLVPNMDKERHVFVLAANQLCDMLDLAVQHIKSLQDQIQKLNKEVDSCNCGCKKIKDS